MISITKDYNQEFCGAVSCTDEVIGANIQLDFVSCGRDFTGKICEAGACLIKKLGTGCE